MKCDCEYMCMFQSTKKNHSKNVVQMPFLFFFSPSNVFIYITLLETDLLVFHKAILKMAHKNACQPWVVWKQQNMQLFLLYCSFASASSSSCVSMTFRWICAYCAWYTWELSLWNSCQFSAVWSEIFYLRTSLRFSLPQSISSVFGVCSCSFFLGPFQTNAETK